MHARTKRSSKGNPHRIRCCWRRSTRCLRSAGRRAAVGLRLCVGGLYSAGETAAGILRAAGARRHGTRGACRSEGRPGSGSTPGPLTSGTPGVPGCAGGQSAGCVPRTEWGREREGERPRSHRSPDDSRFRRIVSWNQWANISVVPALTETSLPFWPLFEGWWPQGGEEKRFSSLGHLPVISR